MAENSNALAGRLTAEAVRYLEQHTDTLPGSEQAERAIAVGNEPVEQRIILRARQLAGEADIAPGLAQVRRYALSLCYGAAVLVFLLGGIAALQAFDQGKSVVNFYWLLLVLLGFNLLGLLFWLFGLWASGTPGASVLGQGGSWLVKRWLEKTSRRGSQTMHLAGAWFGVMLDGAAGRWALSSLSHALWFCYLVGGLAMILVLLAARQYDFVWETTLLSEQTFIPLTQALGWLPGVLGLAGPSLEQISQSRLGADPTVLAEARQAWASLLIASLLLYGVVPRLLLYALCRMLQGRALNNYRLDTARPYYVRLRQRLIPAATSVGIVDADDATPAENRVQTQALAGLTVPDDAAWLGIELDPDQHWPPLSLDSDRDLGCVTDRAGQHQALARCRQLKRIPLALALPMHRSPDRGLARFVGELVSIRPQSTWLVVLEFTAIAPATDAERDARMVDWYALAATCGVPADHIVQWVVDPGTANKGSSHD